MHQQVTFYWRILTDKQWNMLEQYPIWIYWIRSKSAVVRWMLEFSICIRVNNYYWHQYISSNGDIISITNISCTTQMVKYIIIHTIIFVQLIDELKMINFVIYVLYVWHLVWKVLLTLLYIHCIFQESNCNHKICVFIWIV